MACLGHLFRFAAILMPLKCMPIATYFSNVVVLLGRICEGRQGVVKEAARPGFVAATAMHRPNAVGSAMMCAVMRARCCVRHSIVGHAMGRPWPVLVGTCSATVFWVFGSDGASSTSVDESLVELGHPCWTTVYFITMVAVVLNPRRVAVSRPPSSPRSMCTCT